jgi:ABC-type multidrug transport system ATPase subunit
MNPRLRVDRLNKTYGSIAALRDVSLTVRDGEVLGLIGPNGAGKTTLFECIAGVLPAESGTITAGDHLVHAATRGRNLFYLPDGITPWPSQTVQWTLDFALGFYGGDREYLPVIVEQLELAPLLPRRAASRLFRRGSASERCSALPC